MATIPPVCDFGWAAPDFTLPATSGENISLSKIRGQNGTLVMFICNHCPYVMGILNRIIATSKDLLDLKIGIVAINANDVTRYPQDSPENMRILAKERNFPFPYLFDEDQKIARAYKAACTPDFFGFNTKLELQYRGRLDASQKESAPKGQRSDLYEAMREISLTGKGPKEQIQSIGCSIKWKTE